ncbi:UNVERIFIED_CONTAM: hypothetical protein Cloal_1103 [Acetivibrio alkalicellulosi]
MINKKRKKVTFNVLIIILCFSSSFLMINILNALFFPSSRRTSDDRRAFEIKRGIEAYIAQSNDYRLKNINLNNGSKVISTKTKWDELIYALGEPIYYVGENGTYIPVFVDLNNFYPENQKYKGFKIDVHSHEGNVDVDPWENEKECVVTIY